MIRNVNEICCASSLKEQTSLGPGRKTIDSTHNETDT